MSFDLGTKYGFAGERFRERKTTKS